MSSGRIAGCCCWNQCRVFAESQAGNGDRQGKKNYFFLFTIQQPAAQKTVVEETSRASERWGRLVRPFTTKIQHAYKLGWGGGCIN